MPPEQASGAAVDARSDVYALGCMLYRLLTGEVPFHGESVGELTEAKKEGKFRPARGLNPKVPRRLELILGKMMARDPAGRFQSCAEVIEALEALGLASQRLSCLEALR
jgi:serine/threonine-protein kinase